MENVLEGKQLISVLVDMINEENSRIVSSGLATSDELVKLADNVTGLEKTAGTKKLDALLQDLTRMHRYLRKIKLPGDFATVSADLEGNMNVTINYNAADKKDEVKEVVVEKAAEIKPELTKIAEDGLTDQVRAVIQMLHNADHHRIRYFNLLREKNAGGKIKESEFNDERVRALAAAKDLVEKFAEWSKPIIGTYEQIIQELEANEWEDKTQEYGFLKEEVMKNLDKIAHDLGEKGNHGAAWLVERSMKEITAGEADMWGEMEQMERKPKAPAAPAQPFNSLIQQYTQPAQPKAPSAPAAQPQQQQPTAAQPQAPAPARPQQLSQEQVAKMTQNMSQQEFQQRSQQAAQQVNQQARPQAGREQQHQQQARPQQSAQQPTKPQAQRPAQQPLPQGQVTPNQIYQAARQKGKMVTIQQITQQVRDLGVDKVRKMYGI